MESNRSDDAEDDHRDGASKDSRTDTTLNSKRRYGGKGEDLLRRGSSEDGDGEDEGQEADDFGGSGRSWGDVSARTPTRRNSLMLSYERGNTSDLVQCIIVRDVST